MRKTVGRCVARFGAVGVAVWIAAPCVGAQDTTPPRGVRIGLDYQAGIRPAVAVGLVRGPWGDTVRTLVLRDLDAGDRVEVLGAPGSSSAAAVAQVGTGINYVVWKTLGAVAAVQLTLVPGQLHVAVHDVARRSVLEARDFPMSGAAGSAEWRVAIHVASDEIERWLTGTRGIAATRILFVRGGRVYVVDSDGWGERPVTEGGTMLSPAWHPSGRVFAYSVLGDHGWRIVLRELSGGAAHVLASTPAGLNITPTFSPDGALLAYAHGEEDGTDLFVVPLAGMVAAGAARQITVGRGSDNTSPSFSPDGRKVAFTSGRIGHPEVYVEDADGSGAELLTSFTFGEDAYRSTPDWSPDGRQIAYQAQVSGVFQVMTIGLRDRAVRQLTSEGRNEDPSWAPDGRHLVFTTSRTGVRELFVLDAESGRARQLTHGGGRLPAWSPLLSATP